jgi:hypothetical protein
VADCRTTRGGRRLGGRWLGGRRVTWRRREGGPCRPAGARWCGEAAAVGLAAGADVIGADGGALGGLRVEGCELCRYETCAQGEECEEIHRLDRLGLVDRFYSASDWAKEGGHMGLRSAFYRLFHFINGNSTDRICG